MPHMCLRKTSALLPSFVSHAQTNNYVINVSRYRLIDIAKFVLQLLSLLTPDVLLRQIAAV